MQRRRPVMLAILDGWGWREDTADNAVKQARTPNFDRLWAACPNMLLRTSGKDVGLPHGQMGNSEVGHLNIGAGRVVMQDLPRIGDAIASGEIARAAGVAALHRLPQGEWRHLPPDGSGIARRRAFASGPRGGPRQDPRRRRRADGGARLDRRPRHAATIGRRRHRAAQGGVAGVDPDRDGVRALLRDGPRQALGARRESLCGDGRRGRPRFPDAPRRREGRLCEKKFDEFIVPAVVGDYRGMRDGDGILCFNFRADRVREILGRDPRSGVFRISNASARVQDRLRRRHDAILGRARRADADDLPAAVARRKSSARSSPMPAARSCAPPRPRNIRTSLISSTAGASSRFPARTASWCRRRRSRPTICSRKCRRRN